MNVRTPTASGYCMRCNTQREIKNITRVTLKNGQPALAGNCPLCGNAMFTIGQGE